MSTVPICDSGIRWPAVPTSVKSAICSDRAARCQQNGPHLHRTDIFADVGDRDAAQQELKLLAHVAGRQTDALSLS